MGVVTETKVRSTPATLKFRGVGSRGEGRKTGGRARGSGIYFGSFQGVPVLGVDTEVIGSAKDLF